MIEWDELRSGIRQLATVASLATRIDPVLLRALRLELCPGVDAGAEADFWYSTLIEVHGADGVVLTAEAAHELQALLAQDPALLAAAWAVTERVHASLSPALRMEERITWLAVSGSKNAEKLIDAELRGALFALIDEEREGVAYWALRALPRLPARAKQSAAAWLLAIRSARTTGRSSDLGSSPPGSIADEDLAATLHMPLDEVEIGVRRSPGRIEIGELGGAGSYAIRVPDTKPRFVSVDLPGIARKMLAFQPGEVVTAEAEWNEPVEIRTAAHQVYAVPTLDPVRTLVIEGARATPLLADLGSRQEIQLLGSGIPGRKLTMGAARIRSLLGDAELVILTGSQLQDLPRKELETIEAHLADSTVRVIWVRSRVEQGREVGWVGRLLRNSPSVVIDESDPERQVRAILQVAQEVRDQGASRGRRLFVGRLEQFATIRDAARAARSGDVIHVTSGHYRERVTLKPGVTLQGDGPEKSILDGGGKGAVVTMADDTMLRDLAITGSGNKTGTEDCGVMVSGCQRVHIVNNRIMENRHFGVILERSASVEIVGNEIRANYLGIYVSDEVRYNVRFNQIRDHEHSGLNIVSSDSKGIFHNNTVIEPKGSGVYEEEAAKGCLDIIDNLFCKSKHAIEATEGFASRLEGNVFSEVQVPLWDWEKDRSILMPPRNRTGEAHLDEQGRPAEGSAARGAGVAGGDAGAEGMFDRNVELGSSETVTDASASEVRREAPGSMPSKVSAEPANAARLSGRNVADAPRKARRKKARVHSRDKLSASQLAAIKRAERREADAAAKNRARLKRERESKAAALQVSRKKRRAVKRKPTKKKAAMRKK